MPSLRNECCLFFFLRHIFLCGHGNAELPWEPSATKTRAGNHVPAEPTSVSGLSTAGFAPGKPRAAGSNFCWAGQGGPERAACLREVLSEETQRGRLLRVSEMTKLLTLTLQHPLALA